MGGNPERTATPEACEGRPLAGAGGGTVRVRRLFRRGLAVILEIVIVLVGAPVLLLAKLFIALDGVVVRLWEP